MTAARLCALVHGLGCAHDEVRHQDAMDDATRDAGSKEASTDSVDAGAPNSQARDSSTQTASASADSGHGSSPAANADAGRASAQDADIASTARDAGAASVRCDRCQAYAAPTQSGSVASSELDALSGLATSHAQPELFFAHNDHDRALVYALDLQGRVHARIELEGATATDVEDIATGPCGAQECVYLADIGDNGAQRQEYAILRFVVPTVPSTSGDSVLTVAFERYRFSYEDGSHNAESLMVAPDGTLYVVTKLASGSGGRVAATGPSSVYRLASLSTNTLGRAIKVATLPVPASGDLAASAAAAHPCGRGFLLRTYDKVYEFLTPDGADFEAAFQQVPRVIAMPAEPQSEGIDYRADGRGFVSSGEGSRAPLFSATCAP